MFVYSLESGSLFRMYNKIPASETAAYCRQKTLLSVSNNKIGQNSQSIGPRGNINTS